MNAPNIDPRLATIIDPAAISKTMDAAEAAASEDAARDFYARWDRAGRRAWKGIMPRPWRLTMLKESLRRFEREAAGE